ncbi:MAG TPA: molybdopterin-dependent oxidoreductase, partial [Gallionellaceae bacterium]|nr:molybdopterin-dependent oxidoreductase [Gallionellaceae bacterium]
MFKPKKILLPNQEAVVKAALQELPMPSRRLFLKQALSLGSLSLLSGCSLGDDSSIEQALQKMSKFNDQVQAWLFDPARMAPTYPESMITRPFPFNAYYGREDIPEVDADDYRLEVSGLVADKHAWTLPELYQLPQSSQVTRLICVEGWSAIG